MHSSPQFTPAQLIEAGRRAEAEDRLDLAAQFYGHLAEHFAEAPEAAEARASLRRIGAPPSSARAWNARGGEVHPAGASPHGAARAVRRRAAVSRDPYRAGRALAFLFSALGTLLALAGLAAVPIFLVMTTGNAVPPWVGLLPLAGGAAGLLIAGSAAALAGQIARALFDQASAARDLLALERAKVGLD